MVSQKWRREKKSARKRTKKNETRNERHARTRSCAGACAVTVIGALDDPEPSTTSNRLARESMAISSNSRVFVLLLLRTPPPRSAQHTQFIPVELSLDGSFAAIVPTTVAQPRSIFSHGDEKPPEKSGRSLPRTIINPNTAESGQRVLRYRSITDTMFWEVKNKTLLKSSSFHRSGNYSFLYRPSAASVGKMGFPSNGVGDYTTVVNFCHGFWRLRSNGKSLRRPRWHSLPIRLFFWILRSLLRNSGDFFPLKKFLFETFRSNFRELSFQLSRLLLQTWNFSLKLTRLVFDLN